MIKVPVMPVDPEAAGAEAHDLEGEARRAKPTSVVPPASVAGQALTAVIAIMTFLSAMTIGAVVLVRSASVEWQGAIAREVTVQVRPIEGRDIEAEIANVVAAARGFPGIAEVRPYTKQESAGLLEPWLGAGLVLDELPVPRLIVLRIAPDATPDLAALRKTLSERVAGASLDDHRAWIDRLRGMARTTVLIGLAILALMLAATMLCVTFATQGAVAANRNIVEVLHFVGARERFIASEFQRHFFWLGLKGGAIGGGVAMVVFLLAALLARYVPSTMADSQFGLLFNQLRLGGAGYAAIVGVIVLVAAVTTATSRATVHKTLHSVE